MSAEVLDRIVRAGDVKACVAFFRGMMEKERVGYAKQARALLTEADEKSWVKGKLGEFTTMSRKETKELRPAVATFLATCSLGNLKKAAHHLWLLTDNVIYDIFASRRPNWIPDWANWALEQKHLFRWRVIRRLVRHGICPAPTGNSYIRKMVPGLGWSNEKNTTIYQDLLADPGLLQNEVWRLFEIEDSDFKELAFHDGNCLTKAFKDLGAESDTWCHSLVRLARDGRLDRQRLLDASLCALARDPHLQQAGWFCGFHEALEPTVAERLQRQEQYLSLLGSRNAPAISLAVEALLKIAEVGNLDTLAVLGVIAPALGHTTKGTVTLALRLLDRIAELDPEVGQEAALASLEGFHHPKTDVHKAVLKLVEKRALPAGRQLAEGLESKLGVVAPSLRPRVAALLSHTSAQPESSPAPQERGGTDHDQVSDLLSRAERINDPWSRLAGIRALAVVVQGKEGTISAADFDVMAVPHLDLGRRVQPLTSLDELIDVFACVIEDPADPMEVERVLDGISRLCDQKPADFASRTGPLCKRAAERETRGPFVGVGLLPDLCGLALAWTTGRALSAQPAKRELHGDDGYVAYEFNPRSSWDFFVVPAKPTICSFLSKRLFDLAQRAAAGEARPLLSAPTHAGGWIEPAELVRRSLEACGAGLDICGQVLALLRLAPDGRAEALKNARKIGNEWGEALRYALGEAEIKGIGPTAELWVAAARARAPHADDPLVESRHPNLGANAGRVARFLISFQAVGDSDPPECHIEVEPAPPNEAKCEFPTVLLSHLEKRRRSTWSSFTQLDAATIRWLATLWPLERDALFAGGCRALVRNLDWWERLWGNRTHLEALLDPDMPLQRMGYLLLALGLAAKEPGEHGLATGGTCFGSAFLDDCPCDTTWVSS